MASEKYLSKVTLPDKTVVKIKDDEARSEINSGNSRISVLEKRIDRLVTSGDWSASGEEELYDIRIKVDGSEAQTAGEAVRQQINELKNSIRWYYVTPDEYGAIGDGYHDDSTALAYALSSGKPVVLTKDLHIFSCIVISNCNVVLDGCGHTIYIHGRDMPENVQNSGRGGFAIDIKSSTKKGVVEGADIVSYTENSTIPVDPAFSQSYRRGYISYHGFNPTPDREVYDDYTAYSWYEYSAKIFNTKFVGDNIDGIKILRLDRMSNSIVDSCDFICTTEDGGSIGVMGSFAYNLRLTNIHASGFTAKTSRHVNNVGYGIQAFGDSILIQNCQVYDCKNHINLGGGSGSSGVFTTGAIIDNIVLSVHDTGEIVPGRTDRLYQQMLDLHPGCIHPIVNNVILEYENVNFDDSWGILINLSCPEASISNLYCKFGKPDKSYGRGYFGFNCIAKRFDFYNVHAPNCYLFPTGWGYERGKQFDANYITDIKFVGGEIGGIINRARVNGNLTGKGLFKIRMYGVHITGMVDCPYLYANGCLIRNTNIVNRSAQVRIRQEGILQNCEIYAFSIEKKYQKNVAVISAPANSLIITGCIIRKPLDEILLDNEQHLSDNMILDLNGIILGSRVNDSYSYGDNCVLDEYNLF